MRASLQLFLVVALAAAATPAAMAAVTTAQKAAFDRALGLADAALAASVNAVEAALNATAFDGCTRRGPACGPAAPSLASYSIDFAQAVPADYDYVQTKAQAEPPTAAADRDRFCRLERMRDSWAAQLTAAFGRRGDALFQYYADAPSQGFSVYPPLRWNCSQPYVPSTRPWYVAGAAGQKDLVIAIDVADDSASSTAHPAARLIAARAAAVALLDTLSFRDYVAVVPYTTFADLSITPTLVQATSQQVALLKAQVGQLTVVAGSRPSVAAGVKGAVDLLQASRIAERSSGCTRMVALLSSGGIGEAATASDPAVELQQLGGDVIVVAVHVLGRAMTSADAAAAPLPLRRLACASRGLAVVADLAAAPSAALAVNRYLARVKQTSSVRWSEVYEDAFGQGRILSGARPLYNATSGDLRGMVAMDLSISAVNDNGAVSEADVNVLLLSLQPCGPIDFAAVTSEIAAMQGTTCDGIKIDSGEREELSDRKLLGLWVVIAIAFPVAIGCVPLCLATCLRKVEVGDAYRKFGCPIVASAIVWVIFLAIFFGAVFNGAVDRNNFEAVEYRTLRQDTNPYRCCEQRNCACTEFGSGAQCSSLIASLQEGACGGGYRCCQERSYECNCRTVYSGSGNTRRSRRECDRCHECVRAVSNQRCQSVCGTCSNPEASIEYTYDGQTFSNTIGRRCGLDDTGCVAAHWSDYPLGSTKTGYVDPSNPRDLRTSLDLNTVAIVFAAIFAVAALILWIVAVVCAGMMPAPQRFEPQAPPASVKAHELEPVGPDGREASAAEKQLYASDRV